jgi:hypothetical protein
MCKFRHGNEGQVYKLKRHNSLNTCIWQGSNNWKKHKQTKTLCTRMGERVKIMQKNLRAN